MSIDEESGDLVCRKLAQTQVQLGAASATRCLSRRHFQRRRRAAHSCALVRQDHPAESYDCSDCTARRISRAVRFFEEAKSQSDT